MAHNLFGERFAGKREPAWHGLGTVFTDNITPYDAVKLAGLDYDIVKVPLSAQLETGDMVSTGKFGLIREATPDSGAAFLGTVSEQYTYLQNRDVARIIEPLAELWPTETVGALGQGETVFITLDAGSDTIKGDPIRQYFLITDTRNGGTSMKVMFTPVRVVCQNTLLAGERAAITTSAIQHDYNLEGSIQARVELIQKMQKISIETMAQFEAMASASISDEGVQALLASAFPFPKVSKAVDILTYEDAESFGVLYDAAKRAEASYEFYRGRMQAFRDGAMELFQKFNDEQPQLANTVWAAYNAAIECSDWREGNSDDSANRSSLFGGRANEKKRAFQAAMELVTVR